MALFDDLQIANSKPRKKQSLIKSIMPHLVLIGLVSAGMITSGLVALIVIAFLDLPSSQGD